MEPSMNFAPHTALAAELLAFLGPQGTDGSHDLTHIQRVWRNALAIAAAEPAADTELLLAAVILHDCVAVEKDSPIGRPRARPGRAVGMDSRTGGRVGACYRDA